MCAKFGTKSPHNDFWEIVSFVKAFALRGVLSTLVAGLLARSKYSEGPATGHLGTGFSWFPCIYKQMLRWFPRLQVATTCFSCSPPDLNFLDPYFIFMYIHYNRCHGAKAHLQLNVLLLVLLLLLLNPWRNVAVATVL